MKLLISLAAVLLAAPAIAQSAADECARARDPSRCEARQAALKSCGGKRGIERQVCLEAAMPPPDCSKSDTPDRCEAIQKAKDVCKGKTGKALKKCLKDERPKKKRKKPHSTA